MSSESKDEEAIFVAALERRTAEERAAYLEEACGADKNLRQSVQELLEAHENPIAFLDTPVLGIDAAEEDASLTEAPGTLIGRYKLLELIGEGGFGDVYMADQQEPVRRNVALKIIKLGMDTRAVIARFEAERQALALMDHPNIAKIFDAGATETGRPYFVMDLVRGWPITEYCDSNDLSTRERLRLFINVCDAVQHAHQKGIIHRDIKPTNVLVTQQDGTPAPKIIDFGVAKATQQRLTEKTLFTEHRQLVGTPEYMSPEQATFCETDVDTRSDIYSLGVVLYELLVGTTPFDGEALRSHGYDEICRVIRESDPPTPSKRLSALGDGVTNISKHRHVEPAALRKLLRRDLDWIVMKCLEKDPSRRYETASGLAGDLTCFLNHKPIDACPPSLSYQLRKFVQRNKVAVAFSVAVLLTLLAGIAGTTTGMIRAHRDAEREAEARAMADRERQRAESLLARMQLERGVRLLNEGDTRGLLHLLDAADTSDKIPRVREATESLWAIGYDLLSSHLVQILHAGIYSDLSPDGRLLVNANGLTARMWEVETGEQRGAVLDMGRVVSAVLFSPDSKLVATHWIGGVCQLWSTQTGEPVGPRLIHDDVGDHVGEAHELCPWAVAFSPDGKLLATGAQDGAVRLWDVATGRLLATLDQEGVVQSVAFSPDGRFLASGSQKGAALIWDVATRKLRVPPLIETGGVDQVVFGPKGKLLATEEKDGNARLWHTDTGRLHKRLRDRRWVLDMAFSPDGRLLATASTDWMVRLWETNSGEPRGEPMRHNGRVQSVTFSPDGRLLASCSLRKTARVWESASGAPTSQVLASSGRLYRVEFSPDGSQLVVTGGQGTQLWRIGPPNLERALLDDEAPQRGSVSQPTRWTTSRIVDDEAPQRASVSPDGKTRAVIAEDRDSVELQNAATGRPLGVRIEDEFILSIAWSPDGKRLVTGSAGWNAKLWDVSTGRLSKEIQCAERVYGVAFDPTGKLLATALLDGSANLWEIESGRQLGDRLQHPAPVWEVVFSPDGKLLVTASGDEGSSQLRIWSLVSDPRYLSLELPFQAVGNRATFSSFSRTGALYVAGADQNDVRVWRLPKVPTDLAEMRLRTAVALGVEHDVAGQPSAIPFQRWRALRDELNALSLQSSSDHSTTSSAPRLRRTE